jgi:hypothetical protein
MPHFFAVFGLCGFCFFDGLGVEEVAVNLPVKIVTIGDDDEGKIACEFAKDFAGVEDHREAFAAALSVPENAEFPCFGFSLGEGFDRPVHADELVILGDDFLGFFVVEDEVFEVVQEFGGGAESVDRAF